MDIIILVHIDYVHSRFSTLSTHDVHNIGSTTCPSANHIVSTCTFVHFIYIYIYCIYIYCIYYVRYIDYTSYAYYIYNICTCTIEAVN